MFSCDLLKPSLFFGNKSRERISIYNTHVILYAGPLVSHLLVSIGLPLRIEPVTYLISFPGLDLLSFARLRILPFLNKVVKLRHNRGVCGTLQKFQ